jgi:hypothetical protein
MGAVDDVYASQGYQTSGRLPNIGDLIQKRNGKNCCDNRLKDHGGGNNNRR